MRGRKLFILVLSIVAVILGLFVVAAARRDADRRYRCMLAMRTVGEAAIAYYEQEGMVPSGVGDGLRSDMLTYDARGVLYEPELGSFKTEDLAGLSLHFPAAASAYELAGEQILRRSDGQSLVVIQSPAVVPEIARELNGHIAQRWYEVAHAAERASAPAR